MSTEPRKLNDLTQEELRERFDYAAKRWEALEAQYKDVLDERDDLMRTIVTLGNRMFSTGKEVA